VLQRGAVQKLHRDEGLSLVLPNLVNSANIGVVQSRGRACFAAKALKSARILGKLRREKLERHEPAQFQVFGFVDNAHPPAAQLLDDAVVRDGLADHRACSDGALSYEVAIGESMKRRQRPLDCGRVVGQSLPIFDLGRALCLSHGQTGNNRDPQASLPKHMEER